MGFNVLTNPFGVLGLTTAATIATVNARAREIGNNEASAASRALISPRTRLAAELSYLPEATQTQVDNCLRALRAGDDQDLWALVPLARANVLAHIASSGLASAGQLRDLIGLQEAISKTALEAVNRERAASKMPPVSIDALDEQIQILESQHVEAVIAGAIALRDGANFLSELLHSCETSVNPQSVFLRNCATRWEHINATTSAHDLETAEPLEALLNIRPDLDAATKLKDLILRFALRTRPAREAARIFGLQHGQSIEAMQRWQSVALDLNNRVDAVDEAVVLLEALVRGFGSYGDVGERIAINLSICRERLAVGDGTPEMRRLSKAIRLANISPTAFAGDYLSGDQPAPNAPKIVAELYHSFVAAAGVAKSDRPWQILRTFSLMLHNEKSLTGAALFFTRIAIRHKNERVSDKTVFQLFLADERTLSCQILLVDFNNSVKNKNWGDMRRILGDLIQLTDDLTQRKDYKNALRKLQLQAVKRYMTLGFYTICGLGLLFAFLNQPTTPTRSTSSAAASRPNSVAPTAPDAVRIATQPAAGAKTLSLTEVRWCRYQQVRVDAAEAYLEAKRQDTAPQDAATFNTAVATFNAYIQPFNSSCGSYSYRKTDGTIIDAEVNEKKQMLWGEGRLVIMSVYQSANVPKPPPLPRNSSAAPAQIQPMTAPVAVFSPPSASAHVPSTSSPVQSTYLPPAAPASKAYSDGQADRREWESWYGGLGSGMREGAEWWARVRSTTKPPTCASVPPSIDRAAVTIGCNQAKNRLGISDQRRRNEPDYRAGWNNP